MLSRAPFLFPSAMLTIGSLRMFNTFESAGVFEGRMSRLDDLILEHLITVRELEKLNAHEEVLIRMAAEGFTYQEMAEEIGSSVSTVGRKMRQVRWSLYGINASPS